MFGLSSLIMELGSTSIFSSLESLDYQAISEDHLGDIQATYNNQKISVQVFTGDDYDSISKKIMYKANFDYTLFHIGMNLKYYCFIFALFYYWLVYY